MTRAHASDKQKTAPGRVSVVVVNFRGTDDTLECLRQLRQLSGPDDVELICVDNASGDGSIDRLRQSAPAGTTIIESEQNLGFAGGCNLGAAAGTGQFLAFINNDARPDREWLTEALAVLRVDSTVACIASKVLDWDGINVDFVDGALTWYGMGYKPGAGSPYVGGSETENDVLFPTGSALIIRTDDYWRLDGFDERYFMFYEDVDLGWRLNLLGRRVRYVPSSVVYHKHHASMKEYGAYSEWFLLERNALMTMYKNLGQEALNRLLAPALALSVRRSLAIGGSEPQLLDLQQGLGGERSESMEVSKRSLAGPYAIDSFVDHLPTLAASREQVQSTRVRPDRELLPLLRNALEPAIPNSRYLDGHQSLVDAFEIAELFNSRQRILVITGDPLAPRMAGPAIRAYNIATQLATAHDVRLVSTAGCTLSDSSLECAYVPAQRLASQVSWADVVLFHGFITVNSPWLLETGKVLIIDLYDPLLIEQLEQTRGDEPIQRDSNVSATTAALNLQLERGDFFLCASERQRHFWLGQLASLGRLNRKTYDADPSMSGLVSIVPFGLPAEAPQQSRSAIKGGAFAGISPDDKVVLWAGGVYNWFDPLTLITAVSVLAERRPTLRLFFLGSGHPNPLVPEMRMAMQARALADQLGLTDKVVFFNEGWVEYHERQNYLLDADLGVSTHFEHIETTFSFRTRMLDYLWAGLPIVATEGDTFGDLVASRGLGVAVPEQNVQALVEALDRCLYDAPFAESCRRASTELARHYTWPIVLKPVLDFCSAPHRASDAIVRRRSTRAGAQKNALTEFADMARLYTRQHGVGALARRGPSWIAGRVKQRRRSRI